MDTAPQFGPQTGGFRVLAALILGGASLAAAYLAPQEFLPDWPPSGQEPNALYRTAGADDPADARQNEEDRAGEDRTREEPLADPDAPLARVEEAVQDAWAFVTDTARTTLDKTSWPEGVEQILNGRMNQDLQLPSLPEAEDPPLPPDDGPVRTLYGASFGEALSIADAQTRWTRLIAARPELKAFDSALVKSKLWAVWPVHDLVATGGERAVLKEICTDLRATGTPCTFQELSSADVAGYLTRTEAKSEAETESDAPAPAEETDGAALSPAPKPAPLPGETEPAAADVAMIAPPVHYLGFGPDGPDADLRTARLMAVGDVMIGSDFPHRGLLHPDLRPGRTLDGVIDRDLLDLLRAGDISFFNLEGVLLDGGASAKACDKCFAFRSPTHYADFLAEAGFDIASLANNHSGDFGAEGRASTRAALDGVGIAVTGLDEAGARTASLTLDNGLRAGFAAFAPSPGTLSLHDLPRARDLVRDLDADHDIVVVSVHAGAEGPRASRVPRRAEIYLGENRGDVHAFAHAMVAAGADLVLGHGPHVPRAVEIIDGRLVAYSLGNFWTYTGFISWGMLGVGPVLDVTLAADGSLQDFSIHSTRQAGLGVPALDPKAEARRFTLDRTRRDFPETFSKLMSAHGPQIAAVPPVRADQVHYGALDPSGLSAD